MLTDNSGFDSPHPAATASPSYSPTPVPPTPGQTSTPLYPAAAPAGGLDLSNITEDSSGGAQPRLPDLPIWWGPQPFGQDAGSSRMKGVQAGGYGAGAAKGSMALDWLTTIFLTDKAQWDSLVGLMISNGYIAAKDTIGPDGPAHISAAWTQAVQGSATAAAAGQNITPFDYIKVWGLRSGAAGNLGGKGTKSHAHQTTTNTSTQIDDASSIAKTAQQVAVDKLGTGLSKGKVNAVVALVQELERAHPQTNTTTEDQTTTGAGTADTNTTSSTSSTSHGPYDPTLDIQGYVQSQPDYALNQASTTYFNAAMQALGALNPAGA